MLTVVKNYWNFFKKSIKYNLASVVEYKKSFIIQSIFMMFNNLFFLIFWIVVFNATGDINGITMNDILYLWSLPVIAYGIAFFFFGGATNLGKYILEGGLDSYLTQPKNVIINVIFSKMEFAAFGDLIYGLIIGLFAVEFNLFKYIILVLFGIIGSIFYVCTQTLIRLLTIWAGDTDNIERVYTNTLLINFTNYPDVIYGNIVKTLIYTIVPAGYIAFIPIKFINTFDIKYLLIFILAASVYVGLTTIISKKAFVKYESGNNITLRS